jgi:uncharacterized protein YdeI (YjbR/CyaY-like superfamily)
MMNSKVDEYLAEGCGRCSLGGTPQCKVHFWPRELKFLRKIMLDCGLTEEVKWDVPCYTYQNSNIAIVAAFKESATVSFFKGALLSDSEMILEKPGEHTQAARLIRFKDIKKIAELEDTLKAYVFEAIEIEKAGLKVKSKPVSEFDVPEELTSAFKLNPDLKKAFNSLTPGRQKAYLLHFSSAKQSKTREARIEKWIPKIMMGKGFLE